MNVTGSGKQIDKNLTKPGSRYALIDRFGMKRGEFNSALEAAEAANRIWPGLEQDEDRTGKGWDVEVVGS